MSTTSVLIKENLKAWLRARGFWLIVLAALVPPLLTGAWVITHQDDVAVTDVTYDGPLESGQTVNITATIENRFDHAVGPFNATVRVGFFQERSDGSLAFSQRESQSFRIDRLGPHGTTDVTMEWEAEPGTFIFQALVDVEDEVNEIEERNNDNHIQVQVRFPEIRPDFDPGTGGQEGTPADLRLVSVAREPQDIYQRDDATLTVRVRNAGDVAVQNATVRMQVHIAQERGYSPFPNPDLQERVDLEPGQERDVTFDWRPTQIGQYALVASVDPGQDFQDTNTSDNVVIQQTFVDRRFFYEPPEEKATAKDFYRDVLGLLHLRLLIPLIALFYAGSVLEDERERGHLPYLLSRPVPRWLLPITRFATTVVVAGIALLVGVLATLIVLLGAPQAAPGFLYWPLWFTLLALAVYSAVFVLVGVVARRPYLVGLLYVIGFEAIILIGQNILVNGNPLLQDWVLRLSLNHWVQQAFAGWDPSLGAQWTPATDAAARAMWVILSIAAASLAAAAWWMQRREFED